MKRDASKEKKLAKKAEKSKARKKQAKASKNPKQHEFKKLMDL